MAHPTKRGRAETTPKRKRARRVAKSLEDVLPEGPQALTELLCPWTQPSLPETLPLAQLQHCPVRISGAEVVQRMLSTGRCDHIGFHMGRDLGQLAFANSAHWQTLRAPYQNANRFADMCHHRVIDVALYFVRTSFEHPLDETELNMLAGTLTLLQRREARVLAMAKAALSGFEDRDLAYLDQEELRILCYLQNRRPWEWHGDPECPALAPDPRKPLELKRLESPSGSVWV